MGKSKCIVWTLFLVFSISISTINAQQYDMDNKHLSAQQKSLVTIAALTATGNLDNLKIQLDSALDAGVTINEIKEALVQLYAYCGFPRSLNAINTFKTVLDARMAKGIIDKEGRAIIVENNVKDKYEQGRKVLEELTKMPQSRPAPGFGVFVPRIDVFLKEHLFADVFVTEVLSYQQRELVTIGALASMSGVEAQLRSHINIGKNTGISASQLSEIAGIIDKRISKTQSNTVRKIIGEPVVPVVETDIMVRVSEIEIVPEYLEEYRSVLKEEASASMKSEPGVIAIFPMFQSDAPEQVRIIEIYVNKAAYHSHLQTPHFQHYKTTTLKMVKALKLLDMNSIDKDVMHEIFEKLK